MNPEAIFLSSIFLSLCPPAFGLCGEPACRQPIRASGYSSKQLNPTLLVDSEERLATGNT
jgi:hypothetical protein